MEFISLYNSLNSFFLNVDDTSNTGNFFFSFQKNGYLLEDLLFQTENKAKETLSNIVNSLEMFSLNLHYYSKIDKKLSDFYKNILIDNAQPFFKEDSDSSQKEQTQLDFDKIYLTARNDFDRFGELASENGLATTYKPCLFEPLSFAQDAQFWQKRDFTFNASISQTSQTTISFEFVKVKITIPWFNNSFINYPNWFVSDFLSGQAITEGMFAIPHEVIIIRNLTITGDWNTETIVTPGSVDSYSPFSYPSNTTPIVETRMQIIGWIFEKLPVLPPHSESENKLDSFSLIENAGNGLWYLGQMITQNTIYSATSWSNQTVIEYVGQAGFDSNVLMEDHNYYSALRIWPPPIFNGTIKGIIGPYRIGSGGYFLGSFGFAIKQKLPDQVPGILYDVCVVQLNNGVLLSKEVILSGNKYHNGTLLELKANISKWVGKDIYIELNIYTGQYYLGVMTYWIEPRIEFF